AALPGAATPMTGASTTRSPEADCRTPRPPRRAYTRARLCRMYIAARLARADELDTVGELTAQAYLADGLVPPGSGYQDRLRAARHRAQHTDVLVASHG